MFEHVLQEARGDLAGNDLGRVVIQHDGLHDPIVVPLQPWDQLDSSKVMDTIEKVLNSHQNLAVDESMDIAVEIVDLPKGGARKRITKIKGDNNCPGKFGFREVTFEGADTADKFGSWLFTEQHKYFKVVAHNMKGYDSYFLLEYLIDQSMRPDKIIY